MEIKEIRALIDLMKKNDLAVFKIEEGDFKITLKTPEGASSRTVVQGVASPSPSLSSLPAAAAMPAPKEAAPTPSNFKEILSPMVGTFYTAASPDSPAFVEVGKEIHPESVVCIIEAMKVMNEIKAELAGTVVEIVAANGKPVQFGEVLFRVK
ncbi:MAG: acetyl-CoA carboxylase biotin carboxyl carrier protein [Chthoniobacterales bacterium]